MSFITKGNNASTGSQSKETDQPSGSDNGPQERALPESEPRRPYGWKGVTARLGGTLGGTSPIKSISRWAAQANLLMLD